MNKAKTIKSGVVLFAVLAFFSQTKASAENCQLHADAINGSIVVNACPTVVYEAIKHSRYQEPARRKVVQGDQANCVLEESFKGLPIIGDVVCRYKEVEVGGQRIEYQILSSDKFKHFDGAWEVEPLNEGKATKLKLSSYVEPHLRVPFAKQITAVGTKKDIKRRLTFIKNAVEHEEHHKS